MKILPRTQFGNPILRQKAKTVPLSFLKTTKGKELIKRMIYTMHLNGIGCIDRMNPKTIMTTVEKLLALDLLKCDIM